MFILNKQCEFNVLAQNGSLPRGEDDKDGHYIFEVGENFGENLTSGCNYLILHQKMFTSIVWIYIYIDYVEFYRQNFFSTAISFSSFRDP